MQKPIISRFKIRVTAHIGFSLHYSQSVLSSYPVSIQRSASSKSTQSTSAVPEKWGINGGKLWEAQYTVTQTHAGLNLMH